MAGILKRTERKEDCWEYVSNIFNSSEVSDILEFSYKHLPNCLNPCFLYFQEETTISASKLIWLCISEGFVQQPNIDHNSLEKAAENCLNELVYRSLVMIGRRSSKGGVKACRIHDVLRDFFSVKLQDERHILQVHRFGGNLILYGDLGKCICSSLFYYGLGKAISFRRSPLNYNVILLCELLRVLDLGNAQLGSNVLITGPVIEPVACPVPGPTGQPGQFFFFFFLSLIKFKVT
ncbi:hypothetical protein ACH5RR_034390 [Cinchona calisaya]|uniref:Disease resistance protein winged helix domain-containing protein n=1 Tax=Cinchona calisaya TaxID=153742 RepID=A0ABD2YEP3_9GENT